MLAAGTRLGRYEVLFPIASGGMATVYAARAWGEGRFRKPVALKVPLPTLAAQPRFRDMLMDEATLSACVTSPHVVSTIDLVRNGRSSSSTRAPQSVPLRPRLRSRRRPSLRDRRTRSAQ